MFFKIRTTATTYVNARVHFPSTTQCHAALHVGLDRRNMKYFDNVGGVWCYFYLKHNYQGKFI